MYIVKVQFVLNFKKVTKFSLLLFLISINSVFAQDFTNHDLNGVIGISNIPFTWSVVPETDPNSLSTSSLQSTPDVTGTSGPNSGAGINGNPYSGSTMVSGLNGSSGSSYWHEGIMQTVSGFNVGCTYDVNFFQTVVKQTNALDISGSWAVYLDNTLIGISTPSTSNLPYNSNALVWDFRTVSFTATSSTHTIKFLPQDDDNNHLLSSAEINGGLRMGIDSIYIFSYSSGPITTRIGNDTTICENTSLLLNATTLGATYIWDDNSTSATRSINTAGVYWVDITNVCSNNTYRDSIIVSILNLPVVNLGPDVDVCENTAITLDASFPGSTYLWDDGSTLPVNVITLEGLHSVTVTNACGVKTDDIEITYKDCSESECYVYIPNSFTLNNDGVNDVFGVVTECIFKEFNFTVFNIWGEVLFSTKDPLTLWDGKYNNETVKTGSYTWKLNYSIPNSSNVFNKAGHLNVLR